MKLVRPVDDPLLVADVCCGGGMGSDGYAMAGLTPHGFDIEPQPDYPYRFRQLDGLEWLKSSEPNRYDLIHTSWPCQPFTNAAHLRKAQGGVSRYPDLLTPGLALLRSGWSHKPWVCENVDARGVVDIMKPRPGEYLVRLCGSMFPGLEVQRHRWFLANFPLRQPACDHSRFPPDPITGKPRPWGVYHVPSDNVPSGGRTARSLEHGMRVMGVFRPMPWAVLKEGFPPHYTAHVGADAVRHILSGTHELTGARTVVGELAARAVTA